MNATISKNIGKYRRLFPSVKNLHISPSSSPNKRLKAEFIMNGRPYIVHFGLKGAYTYADGAPISKRDSYRARASKITNAKGEYTYKIPGTANSFAYHLLW